MAAQKASRGKTERPAFAWAEEVVVAEIPKANNVNDFYRVSACVGTNGAPLLNFREFYLHRESGEHRPTKSGAAIPLANTSDLLDAFGNGLALLQKRVKTGKPLSELHAQPES